MGKSGFIPLGSNVLVCLNYRRDDKALMEHERGCEIPFETEFAEMNHQEKCQCHENFPVSARCPLQYDTSDSMVVDGTQA